jgi:Fe-S oxidoreductase
MEKMITIYVLGKKYTVPAGLTIMKAMEFCGYKFIRGCGCRAGFCGACATVYRVGDDYKLHVALACQKVVEEGMFLAMIPFTPAKKAVYEIEKVKPEPNIILSFYPELGRCVSCNTCARACPQNIEVMRYVQAALRGDIEEVAKLSFDCIECGLCAMRCPAEIVPWHAARLARRLYAKYMAKKAGHLAKRVEEIKRGKFNKELKKLAKTGTKKLKILYEKREMRI